MQIQRFFIVFAACCSLTWTAQAKELGTFGTTYPIAERDALAEIEAQAEQVDWGRIFNRKKSEQMIKNYHPEDSVSLPRAAKDRVRTVDMSYTLEFDIPDEKGNIMYPAGYVFNPLEYMQYPNTIVIIDGSDRAQVEWFKRSPHCKDITTKLLITTGNYYDLAQELHRSVFYASSLIVSRFQLLAVPCVVRQKGLFMEVTDVDIEKRHS